MIYKYTKCESVIAKIMADANMSTKDIRITDIREWIFEAVESIGAPVQYIEKESGVDCPIFKIIDNQIPIPEDLETLTAVAYSNSPDGIWTPCRKNEQTFKFINSKCKYDDRYTHVPQLPDYKKILPFSREIVRNNSSKSAESVLSSQDPTYFIKPGWIVLNKDQGYVKIAYKAIATDERGYPLIPDIASYQEAIYWYVMMKLKFPKFLSGQLGGRARYNGQAYHFIVNNWHFYKQKAYGDAIMPNEGEMMSIKNEWNKLIPDYESDENFFSDSGRKQLNYNDYYYGY